MTFRIRGLDPAPFQGLYGLDDAALAARGVVRMRVDAPVSAPCRVGLDDAEPGEHVLLMAYEHQGAATPFHACGPIFVREGASAAWTGEDEIPPALRIRTLSARAYDQGGMMIEGELVEGAAAGELLARWFERPEIEEAHLHYARRGCFAARARRG